MYGYSQSATVATVEKRFLAQNPVPGTTVGFNLIANLKMWERLPADVQAVIQRNALKYVKLQRADNDSLNGSLRAKLTERGMVFNDVDPASFKAMLAGYYARWKQEIGQKAWTLLEQHVGKTG